MDNLNWLGSHHKGRHEGLPTTTKNWLTSLTETAASQIADITEEHGSLRPTNQLSATRTTRIQIRRHNIIKERPRTRKNRLFGRMTIKVHKTFLIFYNDQIAPRAEISTEKKIQKDLG
jgi:hypothetical protein